VADHELFETIDRAEAMPWLDDAACSDLPLEELELFFVEAGRTISAETVARCGRCPVRAECLDHAYRRQVVSGYFGGMSPGKRRTLTRDEAMRLVTGGD
jgi:WhiB family redox-sensing transcriptional regulator